MVECLFGLGKKPYWEKERMGREIEEMILTYKIDYSQLYRGFSNLPGFLYISFEGVGQACGVHTDSMSSHRQ